MALKRYVPFILLNVVVSAAMVAAVLYYWDQSQAEQRSIATFTSAAATAPVATAAAVATASAPPSVAAPTPVMVRHVVKMGETLGSIAQQYDVALEDIIQLNNIPDPDVLSAGSKLIIPLGGVPAATEEHTPAPTLAGPPSPIPTEAPALGEAKVVVREILEVGRLAHERLVIANDGSRQIQLANWRLEDSHGNVYTFGPFILFGEGANVILHTASGTDTTSDLYWGLGFAAWEPGETATLRDADGTPRATFVVP